MKPLFHLSDRDEADDLSPPSKRLKSTNLLSSPEDGERVDPDGQWFHNDAGEPDTSDSFDATEFLNTATSTPRITEGSPNEVCYGMLHSVEVQLKWLPKDSPGSAILFGNDALIHATLDFSPDLDVTFVRTPDGQPLGVLSASVSRGLNQVRKCSAELQIWIQEISWLTSAEVLSRQNRKSKKVVRLQTDILVLGDDCQGQSVARILSTCGLYLQDPYPGLSGSPYRNPQSLSFPSLLGSPIPGLDANPVDLEGYSGGYFDNSGPIYNQDVYEAKLLQEIEDFLADPPAHDYLACRPSDNRILGELYSHQQTAVDFIRRRERGCIPIERSLWQSHPLPNGRCDYQHTITGEMRRENPDALGGILADEMGLGKTLSFLAAILDSMEDAQAFANGGGKYNIMSTLIIVPSELLLHTWKVEIDRHIRPGVMNSLTYHGRGRGELDSKIRKSHIVLTTYSTVVVEKKRNGALFSHNWYRVALDEADTIRNPSSKQFHAVANLLSQMRWCITGTPIQNSLKDLEALVRFLKVPVFEESLHFHKYITRNRLQRHSKTLRFENLQKLLGSISLRRNRTAVPGLDPNYEDRQPVFTQKERMQYKDLEVSYKRVKDLASKTGKSDVNGRLVMEAFLRLRMFCNNGLDEETDRVRPGHPSSRADETLSLLQQANEAICASCADTVDSASRQADQDLAYLTVCLRLVCPTCMPDYRAAYEKSGSGLCPVCEHTHGFYERGPEPGPQISDGRSDFPSKITVLVQDVFDHYLQHKCVVFSFWKRTLDIVSSALTHKGIRHLRVDGEITAKKRNRVLKDFQIRSDLKVLLMTFSTGAVGLNGLTVANRIYILEPQWNPMVETQAIGRVVRLGQTEKVTVIRYTMAKTIEEFVRAKQHFKLKVGKGGFAADEGVEQANAPLTEEIMDVPMLD